MHSGNQSCEDGNQAPRPGTSPTAREAEEIVSWEGGQSLNTESLGSGKLVSSAK